MDCSPPGSSVHGISQVRILVWDCHFLLQKIFLSQASNLGLLHCRQILNQLSYEGSPPDVDEWGRKTAHMRQPLARIPSLSSNPTSGYKPQGTANRISKSYTHFTAASLTMEKMCKQPNIHWQMLVHTTWYRHQRNAISPKKKEVLLCCVQQG